LEKKIPQKHRKQINAVDDALTENLHFSLKYVYVKKEGFIIPFGNVPQLHESAIKFNGPHLKSLWSFYINFEEVIFL